ncbi:MAG: hypothetical protein ACREN5_09755 [Gemmatimonadales bacterium]
MARDAERSSSAVAEIDASAEFLAGDVMDRYWGEEEGGVVTAAKKKAKPKPKKTAKPKKKPRPRPTMKGPGCVTERGQQTCAGMNTCPTC